MDILRSVKGDNGSVVLEWVDGQLIVWVDQDSAGESGAISFDRLGIYQLYADLAVINAAAGAYAAQHTAVPLDAT
jgi:hypothetical protein